MSNEDGSTKQHADSGPPARCHTCTKRVARWARMVSHSCSAVSTEWCTSRTASPSYSLGNCGTRGTGGRWRKAHGRDMCGGRGTAAVVPAQSPLPACCTLLRRAVVSLQQPSARGQARAGASAAAAAHLRRHGLHPPLAEQRLLIGQAGGARVAAAPLAQLVLLDLLQVGAAGGGRGGQGGAKLGRSQQRAAGRSQAPRRAARPPGIAGRRLQAGGGRCSERWPGPRRPPAALRPAAALTRSS